MARFMRPCCAPALPAGKLVEPVGFEPTICLLAGQVLCQLSHGPKSKKWSGWRDLNSRSPAPKAGGLASFPTPEQEFGASGAIRTLNSLLKRQVLCAIELRKQLAVLERLELSSTRSTIEHLTFRSQHRKTFRIADFGFRILG